MKTETAIGPITDEIPIITLKVALAETISLGSRKSFMCATANEYMGRLKQEKIAVITKKIVIGKKVAKTKIKLSPAAPNVIPISITLLSILSERYPIGH
tara:strand:+ start:642 stop:938 length:297 start_codon:yes stop_codon:yes gene_type:complete